MEREEPSGLQSMGSQRVWATNTFIDIYIWALSCCLNKMRSKPRSFLGRTGPGKWFPNAPQWPRGEARQLGGKTAQRQGSMVLRKHHWKPTALLDPSRHPLNLVTRTPPSPFPNLFWGIKPALPHHPHPGLCPPGWKGSHKRAQHLTVQLTIFLADSWQKQAFKLNKRHGSVSSHHFFPSKSGSLR